MAYGGRSGGRAAGVRWVLTAAAAVLAAARPVGAATPPQIEAAITKGKDFLYKAEHGDNWEVADAPDPTEKAQSSVQNLQFGGMTAIATFALLAAGDDPRHKPELKRAVDWLLRTEMRGIYAISLRDQVLAMLPPGPDVKKVADNDRDLLLKAICPKGHSRGFYGYGVDTRDGQSDHSTSQFGVLGLWAVQHAGAEVPTGAWKLFDDAWHAQQLREGAWCYNTSQGDNENDLARLSMTAAGVATLYITQEYIHQAPQCKGNVADAGIDRGLAWMADNMADIPRPRRYYTLFGISRVALAGGRKYIGKTDWFKVGADLAVADQAPDGSWPGGSENPASIPDTGFALLFLARGRAPVMMNKLAYDVEPDRSPRGKLPVLTPGTWNQRPRDVGNVARMASKEVENLLNWQVVSLKDNVADLHDAPLLYMAGSTAPRLSAEDAGHLRTYCDEGGIVLGNADCSAVAFAEGFRKLGEQMYPGRKFRPLPDDSPVYTAERFPRRAWKTKPPLDGLSNGAREVMLLMPNGDPGRTWQAEDFKPFKVDATSQMVMDVLFYAVEQDGLQTRGLTYMLTPDPAAKPGPPVKVGRVKYAGNWDPEPGGWRRLGTAMHNDGRGELTTAVVDLSEPVDPSVKVACLTVGSDAVPLSDAERDTLRAFVNRGGLLLVDVLGGDAQNAGYKAAADGVVSAVVPNAVGKQTQLPADSPAYAGMDPADVTYRKYARAILHKPRGPLLLGVDVNGRPGVILSREDLSVGLVGQPVDAILGYSPASATKLVEAIVTYGATR